MYALLSSPGFYFEAVVSILIAFYAHCVWIDDQSFKRDLRMKSRTASILLYGIAAIVLIDAFGLLPPILSCLSMVICWSCIAFYAIIIAIVVMMTTGSRPIGD